MVILDAQGLEQPDTEVPSVTRGANFIFESMRVGPEEAGLHFVAIPAEQRKRDLEDVAEFMRFTREWWSALNQIHLGLSEKDGPPPSDNPTEQG